MTMTGVQTGPGRGTAGRQLLAIELRGVRKNFGPVEAVRGIDLAVQPGEIVAFLGPNGAGKTTTIDMAHRDSRPTVMASIF